MKLTKDDLYEIEKALDIYSTYFIPNINKMCEVGIRWDALGKKDNPLHDLILEHKRGYDRIKEIRDKLQKERLKNER
jgi:hypothetical protein